MDTLGGYRLIRRLGLGTRSDVWLGSDSTQTAAIKVFHADTQRESIDAEIESLGRASGRHLMRLEDLTMGPGGRPCLILQRLSQWSLGRLLEGGRPSSGEAVTILAPISLAVAELHRVGVAHGRIGASSVLFDDAGAPVLASFGHAEVFGDMPMVSSGVSLPPAMFKNHSGIAADLVALIDMCLVSIDPESDTGRWITHCAAGLSANTSVSPWDPTSFAVDLADRLFRSAQAAPVRFAVQWLERADSEIPLRTRSTDDAESAGQGSPVKSSAMRTLAALMHVPESMAANVAKWSGKETGRGPLSRGVRHLRDALKPVRTPVWIIAGIVTAAVIAVVAVLPQSGTHGAAHGTGEASGTAHTPSAVPSFPYAAGNSTSSAAIHGDDPLAAASALLIARETCFVASSVLCLDAVDQQNSAAMEADAAHVRLLQDGGAPDGSTISTPTGGLAGRPNSPKTSLVERLGDSALLSVTFGEETAGNDAAHTAPFSLLLIKSSEGWRIRNFAPGTQPQY